MQAHRVVPVVVAVYARTFTVVVCGSPAPGHLARAVGHRRIRVTVIVPVIVAIGARSGPNRGTLSRLQQDALCVAEIQDRTSGVLVPDPVIAASG